MKQTNPNQPTWDSLAYFIHLTQVISRTLFLNITKLHQGILLNYQTFQLEAGLISLTDSYSQMLLGLATKDVVMEEARRTHQIRENVITAYKDYLILSKFNNQMLAIDLSEQIGYSTKQLNLFYIRNPILEGVVNKTFAN